MRICILTSSFPRFKGDSAGIFLYHLCSWLTRKGVEIEVVAPHDSDFKFTESLGKIHINRFPYFYPLKFQQLCYSSGILKNIKKNILAKIQLPLFVVLEIVYTFWIIKKKNIDIIHAHWSLPQGLVGILCKQLFQIPCITTIHGTDVHRFKFSFFKNLNAFIINRSNICTANSRATSKIAQTISDTKKIEIIPMGVDTSFFNKNKRSGSIKDKYGIEGNVILYVGRLIDWKGIDYLINAMPRVIDAVPKTKLFIVGSGPLKNVFVQLSERLNIKKNIIFIDAVSQIDLIDFYALADLFVLPSIINDKGETEGLGVVLLEAMACGVPVIGTNVGGIRDIIKDGKTGLLARQKDSDDLALKINRLFSDEQLKIKIVENGFKLIEDKFTWDVVSDRFIQIYTDVIKRKKISDLL